MLYAHSLKAISIQIMINRIKNPITAYGQKCQKRNHITSMCRNKFERDIRSDEQFVGDTEHVCWFQNLRIEKRT